MPYAPEDDPGEKVKAAAAVQRLSETETRWAFMHLFDIYYITFSIKSKGEFRKKKERAFMMFSIWQIPDGEESYFCDSVRWKKV